MSEKPTRSVADRLKDLNALLAGAPQILNSIPNELQVAAVEADELVAIRRAEIPEQQERIIAGVRASARQRLKQRIEESVQVEIAMNHAAIRVLELIQLVRHTRGRAAEFARNGGNTSLDEIERLIDRAAAAAVEKEKKTKKLAGAA
jgi:hypothetical protein